MKIAYVVPYVPNLIRTRPYNLINHLVTSGHEVSVFTLRSGKQDLDDVEALRSKVKKIYYQDHPIWHSLWNSVKALPSRRPLQTVYSWNLTLARQIVSLLNIPGEFDIVHVEHLRGSLYGQYIKNKLPSIPVVWDSVDCISYLFEQASAHSTGGFGKYVTRFDLGRTRQMEGKLVSEFDHVLVTSNTDRNALLELTLPGSIPSPITVLSNGVDLEYFHPNPDIQKEPETLVFSGKMSYHANVSMVKYLVREIMPKVWMKRPKVRLVVVGKDPSAEVRAFGDDPRIEITGTVEDIRLYIWKASCAVVPLVYGAGIQNKILEAMACGIAVITTPKTTSSLNVTHGVQLLIAAGADEFSENILMILENEKLRKEIGSAGAVYVKEHHNWSKIASQLVTCYAGVLQDYKKIQA